MIDLVAKLKRFFPQELHDRLFLVGGMVRDILMGVECQDIDLLAALPPADLTRLGFGLVQSKSTPNIYFLFHRQLGKIEVTVIPSVDSLPQDLKRRDFAVNAMAMAFDGAVHDPLKGSKDLEQKILRICGPTSFSDDPARIFRAFRFESDGWRLDQASAAAIAERYWSDDLGLVPVERFSQEMLKALSKSEPGRFFQRMLQFRVGRSYLPEIFRMPEVPAGPLEHHPEGDLFSHSLQVLERMALKTPEVKARFCAMFHDLGKLSTKKELYPRHHGHDEAGALAADPFCKKLRLPVELQRALQGANKLHNTANRWQELRDSTKIKLAVDAGKAGISGIMPLLVAADCGGTMPGWEEVLRVAALNSAQLGIDAAVLQSAGPEKCQQLIMNQRIKELRKSSQNRHTDLDGCDE
jgi:tRNA nucleotidyltransferase (CCA-adding enzyme)